MDTSLVTGFTFAFRNCSGITGAFPPLDFSLSNNFISTFSGCSGITSFGDMTTLPAITNYTSMFLNCSSLECISAIDTTNANLTTTMFSGCTSLVNPTPAEQILIADIAGSPKGLDYLNTNPCPFTLEASIQSLASGSPNTLNTINANSDFQVDWGDGTFIDYSAGDATSVTLGGSPFVITLRAGPTGSPETEVTQVTFLTDTFNSIDITKSSSLTSANKMCENLIAMTSFNIADTSNITDFEDAWKFCRALTSFPAIDMRAASATHALLGTWHICDAITDFTAPNLTGVSLDMINTFRFMNSLVNFPADIDTSSITAFSGTFGECHSFTSFPVIDVSGANDLSLAWYNCDGLTSFPPIDTSTIAVFSSTWWLCSSLTAMPAIDTSLGTNFNSTFKGCTNLVCLSTLDTRSASTVIDTFTSTPALVNPTAAEQILLTTIGGSPSGYNYINGSPCP